VTTKTTTQQTTETLVKNGSLFRAAVTAGLEASFKFSKAYEGVQSRTWGLDGLRHIVQPYMDASFVYANHSPDQIYQFDVSFPRPRRPRSISRSSMPSTPWITGRSSVSACATGSKRGATTKQ